MPASPLWNFNISDWKYRKISTEKNNRMILIPFYFITFEYYLTKSVYTFVKPLGSIPAPPLPSPPLPSSFILYYYEALFLDTLLYFENLNNHFRHCVGLIVLRACNRFLCFAIRLHSKEVAVVWRMPWPVNIALGIPKIFSIDILISLLLFVIVFM